jgi:N-acetylmuramoyl-L-alanine amidase
MRLIILFATFIFLFACDTSSKSKAYEEYYNFQREYIAGILDDNKKTQIKALKELIKCGKYLNFDIKDYEIKLNKLLSSPSKNNKNSKTYVKIISYNPFTLTIPTNSTKHWIFKKKYHIFDIKNAIISHKIVRRVNNILIKIAQFNKNIVRVVIYSKKIKYKLQNKRLLIYFPTSKSKAKKYFSKKIIVIDPGHGGKDSGGIGIGGRMEKIAVLKIAKYLYYYLKKMGYKVYLTRYGDYFIPLKKRTHFANEKKADLFISIHCNIAPYHYKKAHGIETYFLSPTRNERAIRVAKTENKELKNLNYLDQNVILKVLNKDRIIASQKFAIDVQAGMLYYLRKKFKYVKDGGVRPGPFWVLVGTQMPAILIETGYLTNPLEAKRLFNPNYQKLLAKGIAEGVYNYFRKNP